MLGMFKRKPPKTEEQIKQDRQKALDEMLASSVKLKRLIKLEASGWQEFCKLLLDYIDKCKKRKAITPLDRADEETIYQLKLLDHEIYILSFVLKIPEQFIGKTERLVKEQQEEEDAAD